jgi:hypothetical protein
MKEIIAVFEKPKPRPWDYSKVWRFASELEMMTDAASNGARIENKKKKESIYITFREQGEKNFKLLESATDDYVADLRSNPQISRPSSDTFANLLYYSTQSEGFKKYFGPSTRVALLRSRQIVEALKLYYLDDLDRLPAASPRRPDTPEDKESPTKPKPQSGSR